MRLPRLALLLLVALAAGGVAVVLLSGLLATRVSAVKPVRGTAAEVVYATGTVEPERWAKVVAIQRKRIVELCDCEGRPVKKGDALGRLDDGEERALLRELEARRTRLDADVERTRNLVARAAATQNTLDQLATQLSEFEARIAAQEDRIADLVLRAPMDGIVLRKDGEVGEIAGTAMGDVLFWVGNPKPLRLVADVNEEDIPRVRTGQKVLLRNEGFKDETLPGQIGEITPKGDPATKTFRVYINLPAETPLKIGMSVEANIVTRERDKALLVPIEALSGRRLFVIENDRLRAIEVKTGIRGTRAMEILEGLPEDARVASPYQAAFHEGMRVRVTNGESR
jgi:membrane fusion protein (multidrug efflux system)